MTALIGRFRPVAIALVMEEDDGSLTIIGSKNVRNSTISEEIEGSPFEAFRLPTPRITYRIEAECNDAIWQHSARAPLPPQIEQRGIYLPDMSFRVLPAPGDD